MMNIDITSIGAAEEKNDNSEFLKEAVRLAAENGGTVTVPEGVFFTSTFSLASGVTLYLEKGAVLKAIPDASLYEMNGFYDSFGKETNSFMLTRDAENVGIDGEGVIDLSGISFMNKDAEEGKRARLSPEEFADSPYVPGARITRPLVFCECKNVFIKNITFRDSPCWTATFHGCENVIFEKVTVRNDPKIPHNDGVHISASHSVSVRNCDFVCGDDCVAITSLFDYSKTCGTITVENCRMSSRSAALRIGHISSRVHDIHAENLEIYDSNRGIAIFAGENGEVRDVHIKNVKSSTRIYGGGWWGKGEPFVITKAGSNGRLGNITIENVTCDCDNDALIFADTPDDVTLKNVKITKSDTRYPNLAMDAEMLPNGVFEKPKDDGGVCFCFGK